MKKLKILAIGDEILRGDMLESNAAWLASALKHVGFSLCGISSVADKPEEIKKELARAFEDSSLVICTGGLGPTADDLTREAVSGFFGLELEIDPAALERLEHKASLRGRKLYKTGKRQAYFPLSSVIFPNSIGTADAFLVQKEQQTLICLPGVPKEMKLFYKEQIEPWLVSNFPDAQPRFSRHLRMFGISESYIGKCVEECMLPGEIEVSYRASFPEIKLSFFADKESAVISAQNVAREKIGEEFVFSEQENEHLAEVVFKLLLEKRKTLALAESCSGGKLSDLLVAVPGISAVLKASVISYSNQAKEDLLGVMPETLCEYGAVSPEVAIDMAEGAMQMAKSDYALSLSGIAGPDGGSEEKPLGSLWIGIASKNCSEAYYFCYPTERNAFRLYASALALDLLRRNLCGYSLCWEPK